MRLAMIGLGRMGVNIARRLMRGGHEIVAFDRNASAVEELVSEGAITAASLEEVAGKLESQRIFWVMLPAGPPTEGTIETLMGITSPGDIIIDGGNSFYREKSAARLLADISVLVLVYPIWFGTPPAMLKGYVERVLKDRYVRECLGEVRQAARKVSSIVLSEHRRQASDMQTEEIQHSGEPRVLEKDGGSLRHVA